MNISAISCFSNVEQSRDIAGLAPGVFTHRNKSRRICLSLTILLCVLTVTGCAGWYQNTTQASPNPAYAWDSPKWEEAPEARRKRLRPGKSKKRKRAVSFQRLIHEEVNIARESHGLRRLTWDNELAQIASKHSTDMADRDYFGHRSPEGDTLRNRYRNGGYQCQAPVGKGRYLSGGENLYVGFGSQTTGIDRAGRTQLRKLAKRIVARWLRSPSHRKNLLHRAWRRQGLGVSIDPEGKLYATQNFC